MRHARPAGEDGLDLAEFDAEAAELDLLVGAAEVFEGTLVVPADQVTGPVHPGAGGAVRVRDETVRGQRRAVQIPLRQTGPRNVELAGSA
ncbi:hypothetical protein [Streptomyces sp. RKAG290]|uniref:hypothetical protein n=1 Tax=Streptomyces sp. RKAG290 TaxID=2888348 RepID=UPI002033A40C|nr:hypothetical protein [Streptomyces sp. RKAG290]MCM2415403.1 hypothetical protein [Streptomyces sp. RKAG290]